MLEVRRKWAAPALADRQGVPIASVAARKPNVTLLRDVLTSSEDRTIHTDVDKE